MKELHLTITGDKIENTAKAWNKQIKQFPNKKLYAFIDKDIEISKDQLKELTQYFKNNPKTGILAAQLRYKNNAVEDNYRKFPKTIDLIIKRISFLRKRLAQRMRNYLMWDRDPGTNQKVDWLSKIFIIISKKCIDEIGEFDEQYKKFMFDVDICRRAWEKGYEVHIIGKTECKHDTRLKANAGIKDIFTKKELRTHIKDAMKYFWKYKNKKLPKLSPSQNETKQKELLIKAHKLSNTPRLSKIEKQLQKENPVVTVYQGKIDGPFAYKQPIVFFNDGTISVIKNEKNEYGLIKIWRHTPLKENIRNSFPIFPDINNLGTWSWETVRGGIEKIDKNQAIESAKRELSEEIGLKEKDIIKIEKLGITIGNTAIDVYRHHTFEVTINSKKFTKVEYDSKEGIKDFKFFSKKQIKKMIQNKTLICGITQASLLQSIIEEK